MPDEERLEWEQIADDLVLEITDELRADVLVLEIKREGNCSLPYGELNKEFNDKPAALIRLGDFALFITNSYSAGQDALRHDEL